MVFVYSGFAKGYSLTFKRSVCSGIWDTSFYIYIAGVLFGQCQVPASVNSEFIANFARPCRPTIYAVFCFGFAVAQMYHNKRNYQDTQNNIEEL